MAIKEEIENKNINIKVFNSKKGITLIALIITIIVLLILAGVTIASVTGENGILTKVQKAREETEEAKEREIAEEKALEDYIDSKDIYAGEKVKDLIAIKEDGSEEINADGNPVVIGEKVSDGQGKIIPVPSGFYYVGGTVKSGAVISDNENDKNKYKGQEVVGTNLEGNQFVFIPANGIDLKYEQDHIYDEKHQKEYITDIEDWTNVSDWTEDTAEMQFNKISVKNYGGFFIGRYEAGYPDVITKETKVYYKSSVLGKVPISKAGVAAWNLISQTVAKDASESMYNEENLNVKSKLVDSYAWDTTCRWLINSGVIKEDSNGKIDSTNYGNYYNSTFMIKKGTLYVKHIHLIKKNNDVKSSWYFWNGGLGKYNYNIVEDESGLQVGVKLNEIVPEDAIKPENATDSASNYYTADGRIEIATGSSDNTRTNNIYDLAGNMSEWTTETRIRKNNSNDKSAVFSVLRGGSFYHIGSSIPIVCRYGGYQANNANIDIGFRVVVYIK